MIDIRTATCIVIRKDGYFLVGCDPFGRLLWSLSPWDAWSTKKSKSAIRVAERIGGKRWLFNPIAGQVREMKERSKTEFKV